MRWCLRSHSAREDSRWQVPPTDLQRGRRRLNHVKRTATLGRMLGVRVRPGVAFCDAPPVEKTRVAVTRARRSRRQNHASTFAR